MSKATLVSLTTICQLKENNEEEMKVGPPHSIMEGDFGQIAHTSSTCSIRLTHQ